MAAQQICQVGACSSVGDVGKLDTGHAGKEFSRNVTYRADSSRSKIDLTWILLGIGD
jgi:hypothetical protein